MPHGIIAAARRRPPVGPYGSHLAWKLEIDANNGGATRTTLSSFVFKDAGGSVIPTTGGTAFSAGSGSDEAAAGPGNAFDGNDVSTWSRTSTTNTAIGYIFASAKAPATIELTCGSSGDVAPRTARLKYSDDTTNGTDGTWTTAFEIWEPSWTAAQTMRAWPQDFSGGKYKQLRFRVSAGNGNRFIAINELEFRGTVGGADQCSGGRASCDQGGVNFDFAFDNDTTNVAFLDTLTSPFPASLIYSFATPVLPAQYQVFSNNDNTRIPGAFKLQGTNDGVTVTDLNSQSGVSGTIPFTGTYTV